MNVDENTHKIVCKVSDSWDAVLRREGLDLFSDQLDLLI
jgi:hypothetical protein